MINNIRTDNPFYSVYTIQSGDTLYQISRKFDVNPKLLAELNGLKYDEYIYPSQTILIPKKGVQFYITKEDDTLETVSNVFGVREVDLVNQNRTIYLLPGQMIYYKE